MGDLHGLDRAARLRLRWAALRSCLLLSVLFIILYSTTNWITSLRSDTGVWMYSWERYIPFVPLMLIPYMSIDLFFVAAPFICADRRERSLLTRRIALCIVIASAMFLLVPLRLGFERPPAGGWLGAVFDWFRSMDQPHNLLPSLHIALRTILAELYARDTRGVIRWSCHIWFSLIGLSTLLTYQHHAIDVVGGFALAIACFYAIPGTIRRGRIAPQFRLAGFYGAGAIGVLAMIVLLWRYESWILLWPATSLALVCAGYCGVGPSIFRKDEGRISIAARIVLGPVLFGQWLSMRWYALRSNKWDQVSDGLWIGRKLNEAEARDLQSQGVRAVIDLTSEFTEPPTTRAMPYLNIQLLDLTAPTHAQIEEALTFIRAHTGKGPVYIHCKAGYSRTAVIAAAHLLMKGQATDADEAVAMLKTARPNLVVRPEAMRAIRSLAPPIRDQ